MWCPGGKEHMGRVQQNLTTWLWTEPNRTEQNSTKPALVAECSVPPDAALEEATLVPAVPGKLTLA